MTRLGLIARADEGGLGTMTWEAARHLEPDAIMVVSVPPVRGRERPERYLGPESQRFGATHGAENGQPWSDFVDACDVIYTAETFYWPGLDRMCTERGVRLVLHAMPELYDYVRPSFDVWAPTPWMRGRLPDAAEIVPVPVDRERCARREIREVRRLLHISSPAMLDRNGTELVKAALPFCQSPVELLISGPNRPPEPVTIGRALITPVDDVRDYWTLYNDADALLLPRRYGGLSLPMQEAASCGLPIVSLNVEPQKRWLHPYLGVPEYRLSSARMKGGQVNVWACRPDLLAQRIDAVIACDPVDACAASERWARSLDWQEWSGIYRRMLGCG